MAFQGGHACYTSTRKYLVTLRSGWRCRLHHCWRALSGRRRLIKDAAFRSARPSSPPKTQKKSQCEQPKTCQNSNNDSSNCSATQAAAALVVVGAFVVISVIRSARFGCCGTWWYSCKGHRSGQCWQLYVFATIFGVGIVAASVGRVKAA